jgi:hypothetical protein
MSAPGLTPAQRADLERARALADVGLTGAQKVAEHLGTQPGTDPAMVYAEAFGAAQAHIANLLAIIGSLTGGAS